MYPAGICRIESRIYIKSSFQLAIPVAPPSKSRHKAFSLQDLSRDMSADE
jgi:hypothetical protein